MNSILVVPLWIGFLTLQVLIHHGWSGRIKNRIVARYQSTYFFRHHTLPSHHHLYASFDLGDDLLIQNSPSSTSLEFTMAGSQKKVRLTNTFFIGDKP